MKNSLLKRVVSLDPLHTLSLLLLLFMTFVSENSYAQPTVLGTQVANGSYVTYDLVTRGGGVRFVRINATSGAATGLRNWEFATGTAASTNYATNWRPYTSAQTISGYNAYIDPTSILASARYNTASGGQSGLLPAVVSGSYYTFIVGGNNAANNFMSVLSTTYNPKNITGASQSPVAASVGAGQPVTVTTTISATLTSPETVFLRYSNDGFTTSTITAFSTAGTTLTATIPGAFNTAGANISYYIFSSNQSTAPSAAQADYFSLNIYNASGQNVSGSNYTYTVGAIPTYTWNQTGTASWATGTNWTPTRTLPGVLDNMIFNNAATTTVTSIPVETIGGLLVSGNTTVNLQPAGANALTISNGVTGADLSVASGSALNATGASALALTVATGATGSITGSMNFNTSANTLIATDASGITFNNGSSFTQGTGNSGSVFGGTGATTSGVVFALGSTFNQNAGSNPFQKTVPASIVVFQTGSNYVHNIAGGSGLAFSGRTYSNLSLIGGGTATLSGGNPVYIDNLSVSNNTVLNIGMTGTVASISSINGNISVASGSTFNANGTGASIQFNGASQTISGTGAYTIATGQTINIPSGKVTALQSNMTITGTGSLAISGTIDLAPGVVVSGTGIFGLAAAATLRTGNTAGLASSGATGSVQTTTRTLPTTSNYVYNGVANQITGTGLPATVNTLTISNTGTSPNNIVTLTAITAITATSGSLTLTAGKLDLNAKQLTIPAGGAIAATAGDFTATAGPVFFVGTGSVSGTVNFPTVTIAGGVDFGSASNIVTSLQFNSGAFVNTNAPTYGSASTLIYNTGATYGRSLEWNATSGKGYPNNVQIGNGVNTTLDVVNGSNSYKKAAGTLTVNTGSTFSIASLTAGSGGVGVEFLGNIVNDGTITLSGTTNQRLKAANFTNGNSNTTATTTLASNVGADLELTGNYLDNANFTANQRAVFFTGTGTQTLSGTATAPFNIDYIVSSKSSGSIQLGVDLLTGAPNTGNAITLTSATDILDLNGKTFTIGTGGLASTISGSGYIKGSAASKLIINGTGAFGTVRFDPSAPGTSNLLSNLTVNRTSTGGFTLGNDLIVSTDVSLTNGTITLGANNLTIGASGTITVTPSASNMIIAIGAGQLRKTYTANGSFLFPIGDSASNYTPATLNFTAGSYASAYAGVNLTKAKQGNNASVTDYINRFWTVSTSGITSPTCTASFTYVTGDVAGTEANLYGGHYVSSAWKCMGTVNTTTHTISASVTDFGDFTAGEYTSVGCCINPTSGGTIAGTQTICLGATPTGLTSSALSSGQTGTLQYQWQSSTTSPGTSGFSNIGGATSTTYSPSALSVTTWYKRQSKVTCSGTWASSGDSNTIQITVNTANTWNAGAGTNVWSTAGNWTCGVPAAGTDVTISTASFYPEITSNVSINSLTIDTGTSLLVTSGNNLTVTGAVANSGTFTIENNANLKQTNNTTNTGSGSTVVKRNTATLMRQDYVMWSSPVSGQQLQAFSPMTLSTRFYTYNAATDLFVTETATNNFTAGKGYLIRLPNNHPTTPTIWNGQFTGGTANNGTVALTSLTSSKYYSIGNPYASTIDADDFILDNSLSEAIYFWRKTNNSATSSYATYTLAGGVSNSGGDPLAMQPNGFIQVGQGFIAKVPAAASSLTFTNTMRVINNGNQFFRRLEDRSRYWLNLTNDQGFFGQMMVAYMPNATNGYDPAIDGLYFNDSATALTSTVDGQEYVIQGRALPFDAADVVSLGFKSELAGSYTIALNNFDGAIFDNVNQPIYLYDNLTNTEQNLRAASYTFASEPGVFNNRFEVRYESLLSTENPALSYSTVAVYKQNQDIVVNAGNVKLSKVQIYDIRGRLLTEKNNINGSEVRLYAGASNQVVLVKITSVNNEVVTKKVVN